MSTQQQPKSQLAALLGESREFAIGGKTYTVENLRNETGMGFFATFRTPRAEYIAMQTNTRVLGRPNAEAWSVMSMSGRGRKIVDFAVDNGKALVLA
jgi:hypothetical protein